MRLKKRYGSLHYPPKQPDRELFQRPGAKESGGYYRRDLAAALLPVWTVTYNDKAEEDLLFCFKWTDGKDMGELPVDNKKLAVLFLSIFVPVCVILLFLGYWIG